MNTVIKVENLSKKYLIRHQQKERYTALRDVMANNVKRFGRKIFSRFTFHHSQSSNSPFTIHHSQSSNSLFTIHRSQSSNSPFTIHHSPFTASEEFYALRDVSFEITDPLEIFV